MLNDSRFSVAVRLQDSRAEAVLSGTGSGAVLKYLGTDVPVSEGDMLVTSGLDALFPTGINVGEVRRVRTHAKELFHQVEVAPLADLHRLEEVIVVNR